jgi:hypothetical protein
MGAIEVVLKTIIVTQGVLLNKLKEKNEKIIFILILSEIFSLSVLWQNQKSLVRKFSRTRL